MPIIDSKLGRWLVGNVGSALLPIIAAISYNLNYAQAKSLPVLFDKGELFFSSISIFVLVFYSKDPPIPLGNTPFVNKAKVVFIAKWFSLVAIVLCAMQYAGTLTIPKEQLNPNLFYYSIGWLGIAIILSIVCTILEP